MKLFLALAAVGSMAFPGGHVREAEITLTPSPAKAGEKLTIHYTGQPGTKLELDWDPASEPKSVVIDENGNAEVTVPRATSLIVVDPTGKAPNAATTIYQ